MASSIEFQRFRIALGGRGCFLSENGTKTLTENSETLQEKGLATDVLVTHDPVEATALCRSALVLENGHVEEAGTLEDLLHAPRSEMLRVFRSHQWRAESPLGLVPN